MSILSVFIFFRLIDRDILASEDNSVSFIETSLECMPEEDVIDEVNSETENEFITGNTLIENQEIQENKISKEEKAVRERLLVENEEIFIEELDVDNGLIENETIDSSETDAIQMNEDLQKEVLPVVLTEEQRNLIDSICNYSFEYNGINLTIPDGYTEEDLRMLTCMVYYENGKVQNDVKVIFYDDATNPVYLPCHFMHRLTAQVCLNHLKDYRFPNTIYDDLDLPRYSSKYRTEDMAYVAMMESPEIWEDCMQDCLLAMNGYVEYPENLIYQSNFVELGTHFANVYVDTGYFQSWSYFAIG